MTALQNINNLLSSFLLKGVRTQKASSDVATNKSNDKVNCNNSHDDIDNTVSISCGLYYALLRYVNQYIYHTVKLFCFIGRCREYNSYFGSKYLQLVSFLVLNRPDTLRKKQNEEYSHAL
ncbi:hypothetical protein F7310_00090 [Francisella uliginis]|uniref:Uncharacterized protein n=1 Tax=Francisella uliginis TaxID=573570 RepID=A0A1L4BPS7_9GAMM|nr:hypothetical protein F7310_00090 [Francisella uliginis]